jgi:S1-C subfamily serine protease
MKRILFLVLMLSNLVSFGQNNYAEINFMPYIFPVKGMFSNTFKSQWESLVFKLYINDKLITSMKVDEILNYKIYSKGRIAFSLVDQSGQSSGVINITENKTYYVVIANEYKVDKKTVYKNQEVPNEVAEKLKADTWFPYKSTINLEEDISNPVGTISRETLSAGPKSGTGFLLSESGLVVTNHHVIEKAKKIEVKGINGDYTTTYSVKVVVDDEKNDLAILQIENKSIKLLSIPYTIRSKSAETGEEIYVLGYPLKTMMGDEVKLTTGVISAKTGFQGDITSYQVSAPVQGGNSGGPLFDKQGNLTGIINAKIQGAEGVTYAIKTNYLNALIDLLPSAPLLSDKNKLTGLSMQEQVKQLASFVYIIEVNN